MIENLVLLAKIGAPHGIKGEVRVLPFGEGDALDSYGKLQAKDGRKFKITRMRAQKAMLVVKFEGVNSRNEAEALNGIELFVDRAKLPEIEDEDAYYISDLVGLSVVTSDGSPLGKVVEVADFGAGDLLEVAFEAGGREFFAFTRETVPQVDIAAGKITLVVPTNVSERDEEDGGIAP